MSSSILKGTQIYLTKNIPGNELSLKVDTTLVDDTLMVLYDVKVGTTIVIPRGAKVMGNWVTESSPSIAAQLQLTKICINGVWTPIHADSNVYETTTVYNRNEIYNSNSVRQQLTYKSTANVIRRIVNVKCHVKVLPDNNIPNLDVVYLNIFTDEIIVTLTENL